MAFEEAVWRMRSGPQADVERKAEGEAMSLRIEEWLATPEGSMAHNPSWGHNLRRFKHDPMAAGNGLEVLIAMALARKMPLDIEDLRLISVGVETKDIDLCVITIVHQYGKDSLQVKL